MYFEQKIEIIFNLDFRYCVIVKDDQISFMIYNVVKILAFIFRILLQS